MVEPPSAWAYCSITKSLEKRKKKQSLILKAQKEGEVGSASQTQTESLSHTRGAWYLDALALSVLAKTLTLIFLDI